MQNPAADPKAVDLARQLRQRIDADCVILFGSRAIGDWSTHSDIDLMVLVDQLPDQATDDDTYYKVLALARTLFGSPIGIDLLFMTHTRFKRMSETNINHVASRARRYGIIMPRNPEEYSHRYDDEYEYEHDAHHTEAQHRIASANLHYRDMHGLLDLELQGANAAYLAQQAVDHAMKALISALGQEYNTHHQTRNLASDIRRLDPSQPWRFTSNLGQLDNFAGGGRYDHALTPIQDFREMANNVTDDLDLIYQGIQNITGADPWSTPAEGTSNIVRPRWRPSP